MDLQKTKIFLEKLNREFARMQKDAENIARIDVDIMASYVRELYDAILTEPAPSPVKPIIEAAPKKPSPPPVVKFTEPDPEQAPPPAPPIQLPREEPKPAPPPAVEFTPPPAPAPPAPEQAPPPAEPKPWQAPKSAPSGEADILFEEKMAKELSEKLSEMPIADLKKAIALNDRLLLTRELFAGDGQVFESTIQTLNGFRDFSEAKAFLIEHCVTRYGWTDKKRIEEAKNFIKLVRRRYK